MQLHALKLVPRSLAHPVEHTDSSNCNPILGKCSWSFPTTSLMFWKINGPLWFYTLNIELFAQTNIWTFWKKSSSLNMPIMQCIVGHRRPRAYFRPSYPKGLLLLGPTSSNHIHNSMHYFHFQQWGFISKGPNLLQTECLRQDQWMYNGTQIHGELTNLRAPHMTERAA
jgi:hypothetical protein